MDPGKPPSAAPRVLGAVAGFEAGMAGVMVLLAAVGLASSWYRQSLWRPANIMASLFYGDSAIVPGFSWHTLAGLSVYLIVYSLLGALFAAAMHGRGWTRFRLALLGILAAAAWYYLWFRLLWPPMNPLVHIYTHERPMFWGHLLYGAMLGRFPLYARRLVETPAPREADLPALEPAPQDSAARE